MTEYKVGDEVVVDWMGWIGEKAVVDSIVKDSPWPYKVKRHNNGQTGVFSADELSPAMKFKVGDRVTVSAENLGHYHRSGTVVTVQKKSTPWPFVVKFDADNFTGYYDGSELEFAKPAPKPAPKFAVGDWVKVAGRFDKWDGIVGTVQTVPSSSRDRYTVHKNGKGDAVKQTVSENVLHFFENNLVAAEAPRTNLAPNPSLYAKGGIVSLKPDNVFMKAKVSEAVNHPAHYGGDTPYEVIKVAEAWGFEKNAYLFNALKYLGRAGKKGDKIEDLKKLVYYVEREIALEEAK